MLKDAPTAGDGPESPRLIAHPGRAARPSPSPSPGDRLSAWALRGPMAAALAVLALAQLAMWLPHYLTWPYWADHDVFAVAARAWTEGRLPYRDMRLNNFPATIYLFLGLGKLAGWGRPRAFFAFDAALLVGFGVLAVAWSRRVFRATLPGLSGFFAFLSFYLALDYHAAAQRDWHGPGFMVAGILAAQMAPGRVGRRLSAIAAAVAVAFRPQTVLLLPALMLAVDEGARRPGERWTRTARACGEWGLVFAACLALAFAPLLAAGVFGDFLRSLRLVAYGSRYNTTTPATVAREWLFQAAPLRWWVVPAATLLLARRGDPKTLRTSLTWMAALAGASFYKPLSPLAHWYLDIPPMLVWSINLAVLVHWIAPASRPSPSPTLQLVGVLVALGLGPTSARPEFCFVGPSLRALGLAPSRGPADEVPPGYRRGLIQTSIFYPWRDYRRALDYLEAHTRPETRVANVLKGDQAVVSMVDRPSAFPAEGTTWLRMVNPDDEACFAKALDDCRDSVVVWDPGNDRAGSEATFKIERVTEVVRRRYESEARFGDIEIWRRKRE